MLGVTAGSGDDGFQPRLLFGFDPEHAWERLGDWNEDPTQSWVEGPWMLKHNGTYYLTYCAPGTEWRSYAMGTYTSRQPLGPFAYPPRNPILRDTEGRPEYHYVLIDYLCEPLGGELQAGDDVSRAAWVHRDNVSDYPLTDGTLQVIEKAFEGRRNSQ